MIHRVWRDDTAPWPNCLRRSWNTAGGLRFGLVVFEMDLVHGYQLERHVVADEFGQSEWYAHDRVRGSCLKDQKPANGLMLFCQRLAQRRCQPYTV